MKKHIILRIISIYEILGGLVGILVTINLLRLSNLNLFSPQNGTGTIVLIMYLIIILLYLASVISGILLWKNKTSGYILSVIIQTVQIPFGIYNGFKYLFASGLLAGIQYYKYQRTVNLTVAGFKTILSISSDFAMFYNPLDKSFVLGINLVPLIILLFIASQYNKHKSELSAGETAGASGK